MQNGPFTSTDERRNTIPNQELRRLLQYGNLMSLALSSDKSTQEEKDLAERWPKQVERARIAGAFR